MKSALAAMLLAALIASAGCTGCTHNSMPTPDKAGQKEAQASPPKAISDIAHESVKSVVTIVTADATGRTMGLRSGPMRRPWSRQSSPSLHGLISQAFSIGNARGAAPSTGARYRLAVGESLAVTHVAIRHSFPESGLASLWAATGRRHSFHRVTTVFRYAT
jgi:hypothetical protein